MIRLTPDTINEFLERFYSLYDSVIRKIEYCYMSSGIQEANIIISSQDKNNSLGWSNLRFFLSGVSEFTLHEGRTTCQILSDGIHIKWIENSIYISFASSSEPITTDEFRQSDLFAVCLSLFCDILPYSE